MRSCILVLYVAVVAGASGVAGAISVLDAATGRQVPAGDPDALYADRENRASAVKAAEIWAARLAANPRDFASAGNLAKARYWLGTNGLPEPERRAALEAGLQAARAAVAIDSSKPDGHFWMASISK